MDLGLVVSDRPTLKDEIARCLSGDRLSLLPAAAGEVDPALAKAAGVLFLEVPLRGHALCDLLDRFRQLDPGLPVLVLFADDPGCRESEVTEAGAFEVLSLPLDGGRLTSGVKHALERRRLLGEREVLLGRCARPPAGPPSAPGGEGGPALDSLRRFSGLFCRLFEERDQGAGIVRTVGELFGLSRVALLLAGETGYRAEAFFGWDEARAGVLCLPADRGLAAWLAREGQIISREKALSLASPNEAARLTADLDTLGARVCVPLLVRGRMPGILSLGARVSGKPFGDLDLELLSLLAVHLGLALDNASLYRQVFLKNREHELMMENLPVGIITVDRAGMVTGFNRAALEMLGVTAADLDGRSVQAAGSRVADYAWRALRREEVVREDQFVLPGTGRTLRISSGPVRNERRETAGAVLVVSDLSPLKHLEARIDKLEKLNFWYQLAGGMAHQIKNPLVSIKTFVQLFPEKYQDPEFRDCFCRIVSEDVNRLNGIVDDLFEFSRPAALERTTFDLAGLLDELLAEFAGREVGRSVRTQPEYRPGLTVEADRAKIGRALRCLLENAFEATAGGGKVTVGAARVEQSERPELAVEIRDEGPGVAPEKWEEIFSPFCTTKTKGMGMGLPIARRLIEEHGGSLSVSGAPGAGAVARVVLPTDGGTEKEKQPPGRA